MAATPGKRTKKTPQKTPQQQQKKPHHTFNIRYPRGHRKKWNSLRHYELINPL